MSPATRFAPSPTGALHLGHAFSALVAHDLARALGGRFLMRIDDLDSRRVREAFREAIDVDLAWLGLAPDAPPLVQSERTAAYADGLEQLRTLGLAYRCFCSRAEIAASVSAPHGPDGPVYPGTCRALSAGEAEARAAAGEAFAWRLDMARALARTNLASLTWHELDKGIIAADPAQFGDVVLARRDGAFAYHLASTIDDAAQGISHVVRGADLFCATHIHRLLQALLDLPVPHYRHHALIGDDSGRRLAKRNESAALATLRQAGVDGRMLADALRAGTLPIGTCWLNP